MDYKFNEADFSISEKIEILLRQLNMTQTDLAEKIAKSTGKKITPLAVHFRIENDCWQEDEIKDIANTCGIKYYFGFDYGNYKRDILLGRYYLPVSTQVRCLLRDTGLNQTELAERLDTTKMAVNNKLRRGNWTQKGLYQFAKALGVKPCVSFILEDGTEI